MRPEPDRHDQRSLESALSEERRLLIHRYMTAEAPPEIDDGEPEVDAHVAQAVAAVETRVELDERPPDGVPLPLAVEHRAEARRGRPRGRRQRRQVHFHVDPDEDRLLLAAARQFGSQQKGLIAALAALQDVVMLREQVAQLHAECERQRELLAQAEALLSGGRLSDR